MSALERARTVRNRQKYFQLQLAEAATPYARLSVVYRRLLAEFKHLHPDLADRGYDNAADALFGVIEHIKTLDQERSAS